MNFPENPTLAIIGLGYVGLPLALAFAKSLPTIGFDVNQTRINELKNGVDNTLEASPEELSSAEHIYFTANSSELSKANIYIVAVPTPINKNKQPDLSPLIKASELIARTIAHGDIVIYESTVYPGATEEDCIPVIEKNSGLVFNQDFFAGYSPERINPGDKTRRIHNITKITSGSTAEAADYIDALYGKIITAGTYKAASIKVAEAAKVIENTQRDVNIALMNELAIIFNRLDIDTEAVLAAANTKWNFLPFKPGLVGGHCIGVDTYYLTYKAQEVGYHPEVILAGRRINDNMARYVASQIIKLMIKKHINIAGANILVMGLAFKENCSDVRNTKIIDMIHELEDYDSNVDIYDPWIDASIAKKIYAVDLIDKPNTNKYDAIILAVAHEQFCTMEISDIEKLGHKNTVIYDIKHIFARSDIDGNL